VIGVQFYFVQDLIHVYGTVQRKFDCLRNIFSCQAEEGICVVEANPATDDHLDACNESPCNGNRVVTSRENAVPT
jgi:hypothetical protein